MECDRPDRCGVTVEEWREDGRRRRRRAGAKRSSGGGDADDNGQSSGRRKQREEIDRDIRKEIKERSLRQRRNGSPLESVYLPTQPKKCYWLMHSGMRQIPV